MKPLNVLLLLRATKYASIFGDYSVVLNGNDFSVVLRGCSSQDRVFGSRSDDYEG